MRNWIKRHYFDILVSLYYWLRKHLMDNTVNSCIVIDPSSKEWKIRYYFDPDMEPRDEKSTPRFADVFNNKVYKANIIGLEEAAFLVERNGKKYYWRS